MLFRSNSIFATRRGPAAVAAPRIEGTTMKTRLLSALAPLAIASLALAGGTIKIVSSLPRTGSANSQTTSMVNGIKMAIEERGGKVDDWTIAYEDWDDASPQKGNPTAPWTVHAVSESGYGVAAQHGAGTGDINGDGKAE